MGTPRLKKVNIDGETAMISQMGDQYNRASRGELMNDNNSSYVNQRKYAI
jgi:hypothetical protein